MSFQPWWLLVGLALLILVPYLVGRCVKYSRSLPEEDISLNVWPASLLYEEPFLERINRLQCSLTDWEVHCLGERFTRSKPYFYQGVTFEGFVKKARFAA